MATFKVNDRVRIIRYETADASHLPGYEGVIVGKARSWDWIVYIPSAPDKGPIEPGDLPPHHWGFDSDMLAPILPPAADSWAESKVKQVTKPTYLEPERVKEGDTIRIRLPNRYITRRSDE